MSFDAQAWAWRQRGLSKGTRLVLLSLASHSNHADETCWPSMRTIAQDADVGIDTVKRAIPELEGRGLVSVLRATRANGEPEVNHYQLHLNHGEQAHHAPTQAQQTPTTQAHHAPTQAHSAHITPEGNLEETEPGREGRKRAAGARASNPGKGQNLGPLMDAFDHFKLSRPPLPPREVQAVQRLLRREPPTVLAQCWKDISSGEYGDDWMRTSLSFTMLEGLNRFDNWRAWHDAGRPAAGQRPAQYGAQRSTPNRGPAVADAATLRRRAELNALGTDRGAPLPGGGAPV